MADVQLNYVDVDLQNSAGERKRSFKFAIAFTLASFVMPAIAELLINSAPYYLLHPFTALGALAACAAGVLITLIGAIFGLPAFSAVLAGLVNAAALMHVWAILNTPVHI